MTDGGGTDAKLRTQLSDGGQTATGGDVPGANVTRDSGGDARR